ncbi:MAG TPA: hydroxypyruvate isomerase [Anaeromyxobacteraceae bacterium]|nr:hydroxypyruvate isomerase [Anaeromyxobacteraceae bacterium]
MPRFAANLTMLFGEADFLDRFELAARAGFRGVEYLFPYAYPADALAERLARHALAQVLHNLPAGDWAKGERGIACHPDRVSEFQDGVGLALRYARALACPRLNCLAGIAPAGVAEERLRETLVTNLRFAAAEAGKAGIDLVVEPINTRDIPGFYLCHTRQALAILDEVGAPNARLQYDVYHMQVMEGDLARTLEDNLARIGHVQIADNPGRHEPGTGEINYPFLFAHLDRIGYQGWVGCEYKPATTTEAGLGWRSRLGAAA